jgi:hypothetical protein
MAYTSSTLNIITQAVGGKQGTGHWVYTTSDAPGTFLASGYFSDAAAKGAEKGDVVDVINISTPAWYRTQWISVNISGKLGTAVELIGANSSALLGFYGLSDGVAQRASAAQSGVVTTLPLSVTGNTVYGFQSTDQFVSLLRTVNEIVATLTGLGLWKGSA